MGSGRCLEGVKMANFTFEYKYQVGEKGQNTVSFPPLASDPQTVFSSVMFT
jgi:hypothetical protein